MYRPSIGSPSKDKTAVASDIFRIVLYDFAVLKSLRTSAVEIIRYWP